MSSGPAGPPRAVVANDMYVQEAITPLSGRPTSAGPAPKKMQARRAHNNFVPSANPSPTVPTAPGRGTGWAPFGGEQYAPRPAVGPFDAAKGPPSRPTSSSRRRPASAKSAVSVRPGSAPMKRGGASKDEHPGWWLTPDQTLLASPRAVPEVRRPAAEELQHELTMTAVVLRTAQSRLAEEREQRMKARADEELAQVDVRRAKEEARAIREEQRESDRLLSKALFQQRRELEAQLQRQADEEELKIAAINQERNAEHEAMLEEREQHERDLAAKLQSVLAERDQLLFEQEDAHRREAERLKREAAQQASIIEQQAKQSASAGLDFMGPPIPATLLAPCSLLAHPEVG